MLLGGAGLAGGGGGGGGRSHLDHDGGVKGVVGVEGARRGGVLRCVGVCVCAYLRAMEDDGN